MEMYASSPQDHQQMVDLEFFWNQVILGIYAEIELTFLRADRGQT